MNGEKVQCFKLIYIVKNSEVLVKRFRAKIARGFCSLYVCRESLKRGIKYLNHDAHISHLN